MTVDIQGLLAGKWEDGTRPKDLFSLCVAGAPEDYAPAIIAGLRAPQRKVQSGCAELASLLSETEPQRLWPHADLFVANLAAREPVLRWEAVCVLGNLAALDCHRTLVPCIPAIARNLTHKSVVLQVHSVRTLAKMAHAYPDRAAAILDDLFAARDHFPGTKLGHLVEVMHYFADDELLRRRARDFVAPLAHHQLPAVATKARRALRALAG